MTTDLATLPRTELTKLVRRLATERNAARRAAVYWHGLVKDQDADRWSTDRVTSEAVAILALIGPDPEYLTHRRQILENPSGPQPANLVRPKRPGPRCGKGRKPCGKPLDENGLCSSHDHRIRRALRQGAAA